MKLSAANALGNWRRREGECLDGLCRIGVWNVRGLNDECKRLNVVQIMNDRGYDVLALSETKLKGKGEIDWEGVKGIKSGIVGRERAREGVLVLLSERFWKNVREYKEVNSRIVWVRVMVNGYKWVIVVAYAPCGSNANEKKEFWMEMDEVR